LLAPRITILPQISDDSAKLGDEGVSCAAYGI
jgi:hypothetical protein